MDEAGGGAVQAQPGAAKYVREVWRLVRDDGEEEREDGHENTEASPVQRAEARQDHVSRIIHLSRSTEVRRRLCSARSFDPFSVEPMSTVCSEQRDWGSCARSNETAPSSVIGSPTCRQCSRDGGDPCERVRSANQKVAARHAPEPPSEGRTCARFRVANASDVTKGEVYFL